MVANAHRRPLSVVAVVEADAPMWAQRMALKLLNVFWLVSPRQPMPLWSVLKADLPPPSDFPWSLVAVTDQACIAVSTGASWQKIAFGGPV